MIIKEGIVHIINITIASPSIDILICIKKNSKDNLTYCFPLLFQWYLSSKVIIYKKYAYFFNLQILNYFYLLHYFFLQNIIGYLQIRLSWQRRNRWQRRWRRRKVCLYCRHCISYSFIAILLSLFTILKIIFSGFIVHPINTFILLALWPLPMLLLLQLLLLLIIFIFTATNYKTR